MSIHVDIHLLDDINPCLLDDQTSIVDIYPHDRTSVILLNVKTVHIDKDDLDETFPLQYKSHDDCDEKRDSCNFDHPA